MGGGGGIISTFFQAYIFWQNKFEAVCQTRKALGGSGGILPRKNIENLHVANGYCSAFCIIFRQTLLKFLTLFLSASPNYYPKRARTAHSSLSRGSRINMLLSP